ncbi:hypothetical protein D5R81_18215 [Parashewanella spongiae]|uniref:Uncharacterized protein n=1 Tax=Parashewanella spongiae TaxID=342950 RepID=A0A3A6T4I8_9GAMM|nr:hypothetical protein [Parashewanella spongiae]MCL1080003.1 hypothetical protein [Parashewanella spongiae]RJY05998.1 hypothetical protein D5R81_18215 [Parashewanella spongiae]
MTDNIKIVGIEVFKQGYQFRFEVNDNIITTWGSAWSGKEVIKVNGIESCGRKYTDEFLSFQRRLETK